MMLLTAWCNIGFCVGLHISKQDKKWTRKAGAQKKKENLCLGILYSKKTEDVFSLVNQSFFSIDVFLGQFLADLLTLVPLDFFDKPG